MRECRILMTMQHWKIRLAYAFLITASCFAIYGCYKPVANTSGSDGRDAPTAAPDDYDRTTVDPSNSDSGDTGKEDTGVETTGGAVSGGFRANFEANLKRNGLERSSVVNEDSPVEARILREYGAVFLTTEKPPVKVMFTSDQEANAFQSMAGIKSGNFSGVTIELQPKAMDAMMKAVAEAGKQGLSISPRDGAEAGRRNYAKTLDLWNSRFLKACDHWKSKGRLTSDQVSKLKGLPIKEQVNEVLELEKSGIYFNTFFNNSILYSVAAPGTSQHISMLAFDVEEFKNPAVRRILADNGWFRTVQNDEPHFTYLGLNEADLPSYGLKKVTKDGGEYWIPDF